MKKLKFCMILFSLLFIPLIAHSDPVTAVIPDYKTDANSYWGGTVINATADKWGDVIGDGFDIEKMEVTRIDENDWKVVLTGDYFQNFQNNYGLTESFPPGDLYINSSGWTASKQDISDTHYKFDNFSDVEEGWNYVVSKPVGANSYGLYTLDADASHNYHDTEAPGGYIYRDGQAWYGGADQFIGLATYLLSGNTLTYTFNTDENVWSNSVGFHWTMKCGNDVIEGMVTAPAPPEVPEPSTLLLLGLGLTGAFAYRKIRS